MRGLKFKDGQKVLVKQIRGTAGRDPRTRLRLQALGLGRVGHERVHTINPAVLGMIAGLDHLVTIAEVK